MEAVNTETPTPAPVVSVAPVVLKPCPGCGHNVGKAHEKGCIYSGEVTEAQAV